MSARRLGVSASLVLTSVLMLLVSCGARAGQPAVLSSSQQEFSSLPELESISSIAPERTASYTEEDIFREGSAFDNGLPHNLASPDGDYCTFQPDYPGGPIGGGLAYCIYRFSALEYDRNAQVRFDWQLPPETGTVWAALANWNAQSWSWFAVIPGNPLNLPGIDQFIRADGTALVAVACIGTADSELLSIRLGSQAPVISHTGISGNSGFVPLSFSIDASPSFDPDGEIVKFEWDLDGNGDFESDSGLDATQDISVLNPGGYRIGLKATDNDGVAGYGYFTVRGFSEWTHSWGGGGAESFRGCAFDGIGSIYAVGGTNSYGMGFTDILLVKYNLAGDVVWQKTWGTAGDDIAWDLKLDDSGKLVVLAETEDDGVTIVKFSPDGTADWAREYTPITSTFNSYSLDVHDGDIYFCGYDNATGQTNPGVVGKIDTDGNPVWFRKWEGGAVKFRGISIFRSSLSTNAVGVCGSLDADVFLLMLDTDGNFISAESWGGPGEEDAEEFVATGPFNPELWLCGTLIEGDYTKALLLERGNAPVARVWDAGSDGDDDDFADSLILRGNELYLSGFSRSFGNTADGLVLKYSTSGDLLENMGLHDLGNDILFTGRSIHMAGDALLFTGRADKAVGAVWNPANGSSSTINREWVDHINLTTSISVPSNLVTGGMVDATGAVIDIGGGGGSDALIAVSSF